MLYRNNIYIQKEAGFPSLSNTPGESSYKGRDKTAFSINLPSYYSNLSIILIYMNLSSSNYSEIVLTPSDLTIAYSDGVQFQFSQDIFLNETFRISTKSNILIAALIVHPGIITEVHMNVLYLYTSQNEVNSSLKNFSMYWAPDIYIHPGQTIKVYLSISL